MLDDVDARAHANSEAALDLERNQRLAHGRARHAEPIGQLALGRQPTADGILALIDELTQLIGNLAVEAARFDGLDRQGALLVRSSGTLVLFRP